MNIEVGTLEKELRCFWLGSFDLMNVMNLLTFVMQVVDWGFLKHILRF
jgi:hypothetical protein